MLSDNNTNISIYFDVKDDTKKKIKLTSIQMVDKWIIALVNIIILHEYNFFQKH